MEAQSGDNGIDANKLDSDIEQELAAMGAQAFIVEDAQSNGHKVRNGNGKKEKRLTGKQASFVSNYLGEARFNASLAAKLAGYKATSTHSFEAIGSENLQKPAIRKAIDDHFRMSRMTADELLDELSTLARGNTKDKIRAIALLSSHYGILDGAGRERDQGAVQLRVVYDDKGQELVTGLPDDVLNAIAKVYDDKDGKLSNAVYNQRVADALTRTHQELNEKDELFTQVTKERNALYETKVNTLCERYKDSPDVVQVLRSTVKIVAFIFSAWSPLHVSTVGDLEAFEKHGVTGQPEVEIIPPDRRLQPARIERMMAEADTHIELPLVQVNPPAPSPEPSPERIRPYGYCQRIDGDEVEKIKDRDRRMRLY